MKYILLRDEKSLSEIADKAYKGLADKDRASAEQALLKANSNLKSLSGVSKGTMIRVPPLKRAGFNARSVVDPVQQITAFMSDHLDKMEDAINQRFAREDLYLKDINGKMKEIVKAAKGQPVAEENAAELKKNIASRQKTLDTEKKEGLQSVAKLKKIIDTMDR